MWLPWLLIRENILDLSKLKGFADIELKFSEGIKDGNCKNNSVFQQTCRK